MLSGQLTVHLDAADGPARASLPAGATVGVTVSIGVAQLKDVPQAGQDAAGTLAERFIEQADRALYRAKAAGRDRVA